MQSFSQLLGWFCLVPRGVEVRVNKHETPLLLVHVCARGGCLFGLSAMPKMVEVESSDIKSQACVL